MARLAQGRAQVERLMPRGAAQHLANLEALSIEVIELAVRKVAEQDRRLVDSIMRMAFQF